MFESLNIAGPMIGLATFLIIGLFHPLVIKGEYYFGTACWRAFLVMGIAATAAALAVDDVVWSALLGVWGFSSFWSIKEVFEQRERVKKGWFPSNPKRQLPKSAE